MHAKKRNIPVSNFSIPLIISTIPILGFFIWYIADPVRAALVDMFILYHVDELFRYNYIKMALYDGFVFLNPYVKLGYVFMGTLFLHILPVSISSLRIMNSVFSLGTLFLLYKTAKKIGFSDISSAFALILAFTFPVYFLASISTLAEVMFCFFVILAVYLLYSQEYFWSSITVAFIPLFRQEGIIFFFIWILLLPPKNKIKYGILMLVPPVTWSMLNIVLLGHPFFYTFFCNLPDHAPSNSVASFAQICRIIAILMLHPVVILSVFGAVLNYKDARLRPVLACLFLYAAIILAATIVHLIDAGAFCREIRFLTPLVPLMAICASAAIDLFLKDKEGLGRRILFASILVLPLTTAYQIKQLQKDPTVVNDIVEREDEIAVKKTGYWLAEYMKKEEIRDVYMPGEISIDKIVRRLWMYLPGDLRYYWIIGDMESYKPNGFQPLDVTTYNIIHPGKEAKGIFIAKKPYDSVGNRLDGFKCILLKTEPALSLYIYLVEADKH